MRAIDHSIVVLVTTLLAASEGRAEDIIAATSSRQAVLGSAYNSKKQDFVGQSCIVGTPSPTGTATGTFNFTQSLTESQAAEQLGFGVGGRARFGVVEANASAQFMRKRSHRNIQFPPSGYQSISCRAKSLTFPRKMTSERLFHRTTTVGLRPVEMNMLGK